jgi:hypothetical protein
MAKKVKNEQTHLHREIMTENICENIYAKSLLEKISRKYLQPSSFNQSSFTDYQ